MNVPTTPADDETARASAVETGAELDTTPADDPEQIRVQIEQTRDDMSETIDAIQERLNPRNLVEQAKDSVREATVGKVKEMAHNVSDTASGMADSTMEAAGDLADRVKQNPWPAVAVGLGAAWLLMRNSNTPSRQYAAADTARRQYAGADTARQGQRRTARTGNGGGGVIEVVRDNPLPTALAGLGVGMLVMRAREQSRPSGRMAGGASWRRPTDQTTGYQAGYRAGGAYEGQTGYRAGGYETGVGEQLSGSYERAKDTVSDAAERAQQVAGESFEAAQQKVSEFSSQAREYSEATFERNPLLLGAAALIAGAAVGLSIPETESENQWMGEARETLVERAQEAAHAAVEKVKDVAGEATQNLGQ